MRHILNRMIHSNANENNSKRLSHLLSTQIEIRKKMVDDDSLCSLSSVFFSAVVYSKLENFRKFIAHSLRLTSTQHNECHDFRCQSMFDC
jgi:hypothetical protein